MVLWIMTTGSDGGHRRATIRDVARRAGVTPSTVSRILNNRELAFPIAEHTRKRVIEAVKELGYRPNRLARSLAMSKTHVIGMYFPITEPSGQLEHREVTWLSFGAMVSGVQHITQMRGYEVHIFNRVEHDYGHPNAPKDICPDFIDGLIYVEPNQHYDFYTELVAAGVPLVTMGPSPVHPAGFSVSPDDCQDFYVLTKALIAKGHHRIACFICHPNDPPLETLLRRQGYRTALDEAEIPYDPALMPTERLGQTPTKALVERLFDLWPRPTAMIIGRPEVAHYFIECLHERGLVCPRDLELIVIGDDPIFPYLSPSLTALRYPYVRAGEEAARLVLDIVEGKVKDPVKVVIPWQYNERESCQLGESFIKYLVQDSTPELRKEVAIKIS